MLEKRLVHALAGSGLGHESARPTAREQGVQLGLSSCRLTGIWAAATTSAGAAFGVPRDGSPASITESRRPAGRAHRSRREVRMWLLLDRGIAGLGLGGRRNTNAQGWLRQSASLPRPQSGVRDPIESQHLTCGTLSDSKDLSRTGRPPRTKQVSVPIGWKLVGNAVSVPVARWLGRRIQTDEVYVYRGGSQLASGARWPKAAWGKAGSRKLVDVSMWPQRPIRSHLNEYLQFPLHPLSARATTGFLNRAGRGNLRIPKDLICEAEAHLEATTALAAADRGLTFKGPKFGRDRRSVRRRERAARKGWSKEH